MTEHSGEPLILYVPGLKPKPEPSIHRQELFRCLLEGVHRIDADSAEEMQAQEHCFDIIGWTYDFYGEHRDIALDLPGINALVKQPGPTERDRAEAGSLKRRLIRWLYAVADRFPFLMHPLADENLEIHLRDLRRYVKNENDMAEFARRHLKMPLQAAWKSARPILLIGHSMGSIIAYDALWQLSQSSGEEQKVDLFLSMGSPLGQTFIQRRIKGFKEPLANRYPRNIRRWVNISAIGELTAIDMTLKNDFESMLSLGLVASIEDREIYNYFRLDGELNVHAEYGYLVHEVTATYVSEWWRSCRDRRG